MEKGDEMRKADIICALILLGIGLLVMADSIRLGCGWAMNGPRAGFHPFIMSLIVVIGCLIVIAQGIARKGVSASKKPFIPKGAIKPVLNVVLPAIGMVILTEYIGLYIAATLYIAVYMKWIGRYRWRMVIPLSLIVPLSTYILFDKLFLVPMPRGILGTMVGF